MNTRRMWVVVAVAAVVVLVAGNAGAIPALVAPGDPVAGRVNYQGRLTDPGGAPLDGTFPMRFQVYNDPAAGAPLSDSGVVNVEVDHGLFNVELAVDPADFNGQGLWLRLYVDGEWLVPRQALLPVPYALSLKPGAEVEGKPTAWDGWVFKVTMDGANPVAGAMVGSAATGAAVFGTSAGGYGLQAYTEDGYAVIGKDAGSSQARGYGGYFSSENGIGLYGYSAATPYYSNRYTPGVYGRSANGVGVYGVGMAHQSGVRGESVLGEGVVGSSDTAIGVLGRTGGNSSSDRGVYGEGGDGTSAVEGYNSGEVSGLGVYGNKEGGGTAVSGANGGSGTGTWGYSAEYRGVAGGTGRLDNNYGLYTSDNLYSLNLHTAGALMQVVQNGDAEPLEPGDVVAIAGLGAPPAKGLLPAIQVHKVQEAGSTAVLGVVATSYSAEWLAGGPPDPSGATGPDGEIPPSEARPVAPGEYLLVVVHGPCQVKASAAGGAIQAGDLLAAAGVAGHTAKARETIVEGVPVAVPGTVVGKALEPLDADQGLIYVFVTLQ